MYRLTLLNISLVTDILLLSIIAAGLKRPEIGIATTVLFLLTLRLTVEAEMFRLRQNWFQEGITISTFIAST